jgi:hypothetical protein
MANQLSQQLSPPYRRMTRSQTQLLASATKDTIRENTFDPRLPRTPAIHNGNSTVIDDVSSAWNLLRTSFSLGWGPMAASKSAGQMITMPLEDNNITQLYPTLSPEEFHNLTDENAKRQVREQVMALQQQLQTFMQRLDTCD